MVEIIVIEEYDQIRMDKVVHKVLKEAPKSFVQKMYRKKNIVLNNKKCNGKELVRTGDSIKFYLSDETFGKFSSNHLVEYISDTKDLPDHPISKSFDGDLNHSVKTGYSLSKQQIIYENEDLLVYNKEPGLLSQANGRDHHLLEEYEAYLSQKGQRIGMLDSYGVCNRLDRNTSGVILIGKNAKALRLINDNVMNKRTLKYYHTIVLGRLDKTIELKGYLVKKGNRNKVSISEKGPGKYIHTIAEPLAFSKDGKFTKLKVEILTGKSHQIRAHLSYAGYPVVGDGKYGDKQINDYFRKNFQLKYHLLHSKNFGLGDIPELPEISGRIFEADYFSEFETILKELF